MAIMLITTIHLLQPLYMSRKRICNACKLHNKYHYVLEEAKKLSYVM